MIPKNCHLFFVEGMPHVENALKTAFDWKKLEKLAKRKQNRRFYGDSFQNHFQ